MEVLHTHSPYLALCISSIWLFLSCILYKKKKKRDIPGSSVVRLYASTAGGLVPSLVREQRSHMPRGSAIKY